MRRGSRTNFEKWYVSCSDLLVSLTSEGILDRSDHDAHDCTFRPWNKPGVSRWTHESCQFTIERRITYFMNQGLDEIPGKISHRRSLQILSSVPRVSTLCASTIISVFFPQVGSIIAYTVHRLDQKKVSLKSRRLLFSLTRPVLATFLNMHFSRSNVQFVQDRFADRSF